MIRFTKLQALGNDFLVAVRRSGDPRPGRWLEPEACRSLLARATGIGADGLILLEPAGGNGDAAGADWRAILQNADGSPAEFSGNGIRAAALHLVLEDLARPTLHLAMGGRRFELEVDPRPAPAPVEPEPSRPVPLGPAHRVRLLLEAAASELRPATSADLGPRHRELSGFPCFVVRVGNPHLIVVSDPDLPLDPDLQESLRHGIPWSPGGVNVSWIAPEEPERARIVTHERGVGPTLACASGALAAFLVARELGRLSDHALVTSRGGALEISGDRHRATLGGPVHRVGEAAVG